MLCYKCEGRGKLRNNTMAFGKYNFGFRVCDNCKGKGEVDPKCDHCGKPVMNPEYDEDGNIICLECYTKQLDENIEIG